MSFPFFKQHDAMDCGPTCLRMIAKYYGKDISITKLRESANISREGVSLLGISQAAEKFGFNTIGSRVSFDQLDDDALLPCILHWRQNHFVVLPPQNYSRKNKGEKILIADPAEGLVRVDKRTFLEAWQGRNNEGLILELEPTEAFYDLEEEKSKGISWSLLFFQIRKHRQYFFQVFLGLLVGSLLQLIFPFLTQSIVDTGINTHNLQFIYIVLAAQFMLFIAKNAVEFIRSRLLLFISTRVNASLLTGFWYKLMKLPLSYFDTKLTGDIQQRLQDQQQIENFLTGSSLSVLFSVINLFVFSIVLFIYSLPVFGIFVAGSLLYFLWVKLFMVRRRELNYKRFSIASKEHTSTTQLILGMQEIKLNNAERFFRWDWQHLQARLFQLSFKNLSLNQYQQAGALFINEGKNILITFFVAKLVLDGQLTLGTMLAIQYIIGQLNSPVEQLIGFTQNYQDAKIALERLSEIYQVPDEEPSESDLVKILPQQKAIHLQNLNFAYAGALSVPVLKNINLTIPEKKVTAIVGMSGSGKTTLLKLLLKFYDEYSGNISIGGNKYREISRENGSVNGFDKIESSGADLKTISHSFWRDHCGCVMQDGYIFNDTIMRNIAVGEETPNRELLIYACRIANILPFVESLPLGFNTKIGMEGNGISQGQRQRLLIARAVYKQPEYIFFDEATNALDANNERVIMENLNHFFSGKTVVVVAHRLSTVKNADRIVVLHEGEIVEEGTHETLANNRGYYYELVKNQLELGN
ncbi:peptidase domain-containing ABC transporter [Taibaiella soli]|uniref:Peptidase domain-containing ABC transporter n=1 Tax=Taibaiella soli TaxID=1649169 RepID=A0A2W2APU9_9BACT|nr:peptidase domain-containing ABC transporter [Taibaiella soli]PZF74430.1 peptidase domain-containing ABC transporter [Taibaiella soli]